MIPVSRRPEPPDFDREVRQKGLRYLREANIDLDTPLPKGTKLPPYWRACLDQLHRAYDGTCAYLAVYFERVTGGCSVDHYVAKSTLPREAYDWANYRLACSSMNGCKGDSADVLDPFTVGQGWFHLELITGRIYPSADLPESTLSAVQATIDRLKLDSGAHREMRARHFEEYCEGLYTEAYFQRLSPFVWLEAHRQGLM